MSNRKRNNYSNSYTFGIGAKFSKDILNSISQYTLESFFDKGKLGEQVLKNRTPKPVFIKKNLIHVAYETYVIHRWNSIV